MSNQIRLFDVIRQAAPPDVNFTLKPINGKPHVICQERPLTEQEEARIKRAVAKADRGINRDLGFGFGDRPSEHRF